jgi:hypothetical protein
MATSRIQLCINALKTRLENNDNSLLVQLENGAVEKRYFTFNPPANRGCIESFFANNNWYIPSDYFNFLLMHNGAKLFDDMDLLSIEEIPNVINEYGYMFPEHCYPIGYFNSAVIFIDSNMVGKESDYLYWQSCIDAFDERISLRINFETWLDLFIVSQGSEFWFWPAFKQP